VHRDGLLQQRGPESHHQETSRRQNTHSRKGMYDKKLLTLPQDYQGLDINASQENVFTAIFEIGASQIFFFFFLDIKNILNRENSKYLEAKTL
jgi:hypothetical protein